MVDIDRFVWQETGSGEVELWQKSSWRCSQSLLLDLTGTLTLSDLSMSDWHRYSGLLGCPYWPYRYTQKLTSLIPRVFHALTFQTLKLEVFTKKAICHGKFNSCL